MLATSLADGAAFIFASKGSSSPDAEANTMRTAARLAKLHTRPKTAPTARALQERSLNLNDCMIVPIFQKWLSRIRVSKRHPATADSTVRGGAAVACFKSVVSTSGVGLTCSEPEMKRGPEPCGVRASWSLGSRMSGRLRRSAGTLARTVLQRRAHQRISTNDVPRHAGGACVDGGKAAIHVGTSSALRLRKGPRAPAKLNINLASSGLESIEASRNVNPHDSKRLI